MKKITAPKHVRLRPLATVAAVLLVLLMAVPVMAYYVPPINDLMFFVAPDMAQRFSPIQESCERDGIRLEVISASIHENVAEICISIDDLTGDRITEDTITDEFRIRGIDSYGQGTKSLRYDPETGKHILLITTKAQSYDTMANMVGKRITVTVDGLHDIGTDKKIEGKWRITFQFTESEYLSPEDPYDFITSPAETQ